MDDHQLLHWLIGSAVALLSAVGCLLAWTMRWRSKQLLALACALLLIGAWASPFVQLPLGRLAQERLRDRLEPYRGQTLATIVETLRLPPLKREDQLFSGFIGISHSVTLQATPWYAPLRSYHVRLLIDDRQTLFMVQVDD